LGNIVDNDANGFLESMTKKKKNLELQL